MWPQLRHHLVTFLMPYFRHPQEIPETDKKKVVYLLGYLDDDPQDPGGDMAGMHT